ncbi:type III effector [Escherichia coli]|uniref:type III effector n=1 Tax=Escherichia coli TaxID=562 RepID=UPI0013663F98|nr:type III effector [Escherichia coli]MWT72645.1 type III effector [Escherichia coli]
MLTNSTSTTLSNRSNDYSSKAQEINAHLTTYNHSGNTGKITLSYGGKRYAVSSKGIENIMNDNERLFTKRTQWKFIHDLFSSSDSNIKEAKNSFVDFVTTYDIKTYSDKADIFNNIKNLALKEEQWRFDIITDITSKGNNEKIVRRYFHVYTGSAAYTDKNSQVFFDNITRDNDSDDIKIENFFDDIQTIESPDDIQIEFPRDAVSLTSLIEHNVPITNTTINLSTLSKDILESLKNCDFKYVIFLGSINSLNLEGPVFENCYFENCKFENIQLSVLNDNSGEPDKEKPIIGMFKGCILSKCTIENYKCKTSKVYSVEQPVYIQKILGSYLFLQSFVQDCTILGGSCPNSSILLSHFFNCDIEELDARGMDLLENSFYKSHYNESGRTEQGIIFKNCDLEHVKINSIGVDSSHRYIFNPDKYFSDYIERKSKIVKLDDDVLKCIENIKKDINSSFSKQNTESYNVFFKNSNLIGTDLGYSYRKDRCKDCAIDLKTIYSKDVFKEKEYIYMDLDGAISQDKIPDFINQVSALDSDIEAFKKTKLKYENAFKDLSSFLSELYNENVSYKEQYHFDDSIAEFFIIKKMQSQAQNIINEIIRSDRINFVESIIKEITLPPAVKIQTEYSKEFIRKQMNESHNQSGRILTFEYKQLVSLFDGVEEDKIKILLNQLEHIKSFKTYYDSELNKFTSDFNNFSGKFAIDERDIALKYSNKIMSIENHEEILQEIEILTQKHFELVSEKYKIFNSFYNKNVKLNRKEVRNKVDILNKKIADYADEIRSMKNRVQDCFRQEQYKSNKKICNAMFNILEWFKRYPDIVKNITQV